MKTGLDAKFLRFVLQARLGIDPIGTAGDEGNHDVVLALATRCAETLFAVTPGADFER